MGFIKRAFDFMLRPTHSRTMGILIFFVLVTAVVLTVIVSQQQQQIRQRASAPQVCSSIDTIQPCASSNPANNPCDTEGNKCKIDNTIYECVQKNNNNDFN